MEDPAFERLVSKRLVIRRFVLDDAEALASYRTDPAVARYQDWVCPYPVSEARQFIASLRGLRPGTPGTWFQFAVTLEPEGPLVGDVALHASLSDARQAEVGFTFALAYQGQGYGAEAVRTVVQYAFVALAMHRVRAQTDARNLRAQRLLERLGFRRESGRLEHVWFKGAWATDVHYAQLASEWQPGG